MRESQVVKIAKALADPTRVRMLRDLRRAGELTCSQVCGTRSQPTVSHHIGVLKDAGLINARREGQCHVLSVDADALAAFGEAIGAGPRGSRRRRALPR